MVNQRDLNNYYEILEVSPDAPQAEIQRAYQRAKNTYSQDNPALYSMFSKEEARELMRLIEEAYSVLGIASLRRAYDDKLTHGGGGISSYLGRSTMEDSSQRTNPNMGSSHEPNTDRASLESSPTSGEARPKMHTFDKSLPPGYGKTAVGVYLMDEVVEDEIREAINFDGTFLQKLRVYKNVTLEQMSEATRVSRTYLTAIEVNDFKNLPAAVFVRGFVVQMARVLGLDESKVATSYMKMFKANGGK